MTYSEKVIEVGKELGIDIEFIIVSNGILVCAEGLAVTECCPTDYFDINELDFVCKQDCVKCWSDEYKNEKVLCLLDKEVVK